MLDYYNFLYFQKKQEISTYLEFIIKHFAIIFNYRYILSPFLVGLPTSHSGNLGSRFLHISSPIPHSRMAEDVRSPWKRFIERCWSNFSQNYCHRAPAQHTSPEYGNWKQQQHAEYDNRFSF